MVRPRRKPTLSQLVAGSVERHGVSEPPHDLSLRKEAEMRHSLSLAAMWLVVIFLVGAGIAELWGMRGALSAVWSVAGPIVGTLFGYYLAVQRANGSGR
jgi:uncharacterized membrane protein YoaK (UPF0700 family)